MRGFLVAGVNVITVSVLEDPRTRVEDGDAIGIWALSTIGQVRLMSEK